MSGDNASSEQSQTDMNEPAGNLGTEDNSETTNSGDGSLISDLIRRRIPQVLAGYLGVTWTLFELMQWLTNNYLVSPYLGRAILFGLLMLLPAVILVTYRHGRPGPDQWTSLERWGTAANVLLALLVLGFAYGDAELGSMVKTVQAGPTGAADGSVSGDTSSTTVRRVPKKEFRKRVALFYFDEAEGAKADTALRRAVSQAIHYDLEQDNFISSQAATELLRELRDRGYASGLNVPFGLKREIAEGKNYRYILSGVVGRTNGNFQLKTKLYETANGSLIAESEFSGTKLFALVDKATKSLKQDLSLPTSHIEETPDLPVTQVYTSSLKAARQRAHGIHLEQLGKSRKALAYFDRAAETDTTFALAHLSKAVELWSKGRKTKFLSALERAQRHSYRLTETAKYFLRTVHFQFAESSPKAALEVCEQWTKLHPDDPTGWERRARIERTMLRDESALRSRRRVAELAPGSKEAKFEIGESLIRTRRYKQAVDHFKNMAKKYPEDSNVRVWVGVAKWKLGRLKGAKDSFLRAKTIDPNTDLLLLARLHQAEGRFEEASSIIKKEVRMANGPYEKRDELIQLWYHHWLRGKIEDSKEYLRSLREIEDGFSVGYTIPVRRIACEYYKSDSSEVEKSIRYLLEIDKKVSTSWHKISTKIALAQCEAAHGSVQKANKYVKSADSLIKESGFPIFQSSLHLHHTEGYVKEVEGNFADASESYSRYLDIYSGRPGSFLWKHRLTRLRLAISYSKAGEIQSAEESFQRALELYPAYPRLNYHYAQFLIDQGEKSQAQTHLQRALEGWSQADTTFVPKQRAQALVDSLDVDVV